jgi:phage replication-related protein YjqB (UPF0714/DUF867 family)
MADIYSTFEKLKQSNIDWVDYCLEYYQNSKNNIIIMAIHWWNIESWTTEITRKISKNYDYSYYSFLWIKSEWNFSLHITSENFDEQMALELVRNHDLVITIHGCKWDEDLIYVWWLNKELKYLLIDEFRNYWFNSPDSFPEYWPFPWAYSTNNICNKWKNLWIQIEISRTLRDKLLSDENLSEKFINIIHGAIQKFILS